MGRRLTLYLLLIWLATPAGAQVFPRGEIVDSIACRADPGQSYALYLPQNYDPEQAWPVIYLFEPAARGALPLSHFRSAAERFGYILISSNNSRNGSWEVALEAANALFLDTPDRFKLDPQRIYTAGFSGGARVAMSIAMESPAIRGVIACGAGFPAAASEARRRQIDFDWVGLVGNQDMNFIEMKDTEALLEEAGRPHSLWVFEGPHQWPESEWMESALAWLAWREIQKGLREDEDLPAQINAQLLEDEQRFIRQENWDLLHFQAANFRDFQLDAPSDRDKKTAKAIKKRMRSEAKMEAEEREFREEVTRGFMTNADDFRDSTWYAWWEGRTRRIRRLAGHSDPVKANFGLRMQHFLLANCIERSMPFLQPRNDARILTLYKVWIQLQPEAPFPNWQMARSYARLGEDKLAIIHLGKAMESGRYGPDQVRAEPDFEGLRGTRRYRKLLEE